MQNISSSVFILLFLTLSNIAYSQKNANTSSLNELDFSMPANGRIISNYGMRNGRMHTGTDIKLEKGAPIYSAFNGTVKKAGTSRGYGLLIIIEHDNGLETYYAHLSKILVSIGQKIEAGQHIGKAGRTGRATTTHLHFEIRKNKNPMNPTSIIDFNKGILKKSPLTTTISNGSETYLVKKGDTLYSIATKFDTTVDAICHLNDISPQSILKIGQQLTLQ